MTEIEYEEMLKEIDPIFNSENEIDQTRLLELIDQVEKYEDEYYPIVIKLTPLDRLEYIFNNINVDGYVYYFIHDINKVLISNCDVSPIRFENVKGYMTKGYDIDNNIVYFVCLNNDNVVEEILSSFPKHKKRYEGD